MQFYGDQPWGKLDLLSNESRLVASQPSQPSPLSAQ